MEKKITIVLNVDSDIHADCYTKTGVKPSEWKCFLERYVRDNLRQRFGKMIKDKKYLVQTRWSNEDVGANCMVEEGNDKMDMDTLIMIQELTSDAWHAFLDDKSFCG